MQDSTSGLDYISKSVLMGGQSALLTWSSDGSVYLWNAETGDKLGSLLQGNTRQNPLKAHKWDFYCNINAHKREVVHASASTRFSLMLLA